MKRLIKIIALVAIVLPAFAKPANAALLKAGELTMSTSRSGQSSNHSFTFNKEAAGTIGKIGFQYCKESGATPGSTCTGTSVGTGGSLALVSFGGVPETGEWTLSWDGTNSYEIEHEDDDSGSGGGIYIVTINSVTNPLYTACDLTAPGDSTTGTCFVRIWTYLDSGSSTVVDSTVVTATITQPVSVSARVDPIFTLSVALVGSGQTPHSALTTSVATTVTTIPFGNLTAGTPKYAGHTLTIVSNTVGGYQVDAFMEDNLEGTAYSQDIDPFAGTGATSLNAVAWEEPDGVAAGTDTGWLGVGTDDAGVTGFTLDEFFPLDTDGQTVVYSTDTTLSDPVEVLYAIEVNALQAADNYIGTLVYNAIPTY